MKDDAESAPGAGTSLARKIDLRNAQAIQRELAQVYRDARSGKIPTQEATRLAYLLELLRKAYLTSELERRQELLERTGRGRQAEGLERREPVKSEEDAKRSALERAKRLGLKVEFPDDLSGGEPEAG